MLETLRVPGESRGVVGALHDGTVEEPEKGCVETVRNSAAQIE